MSNYSINCTSAKCKLLLFALISKSMVMTILNYVCDVFSWWMITLVWCQMKSSQNYRWTVIANNLGNSLTMNNFNNASEHTKSQDVVTCWLPKLSTYLWLVSTDWPLNNKLLLHKSQGSRWFWHPCCATCIMLYCLTIPNHIWYWPICVLQ